MALNEEARAMRVEAITDPAALALGLGGKAGLKLSEFMAMRGADAAVVHKMALSPSDVHVPYIMDTFSVDYFEQDLSKYLIADKTLPWVKVNHAQDLFVVWSRRDINRVVDAGVSPLAMPAEVPQTFTDTQYTVKPYALRMPIPQDVIINEDAVLNILQRASNVLRMNIELSREYRVANTLMTAANYASGNVITLAGLNQWDAAGGGSSDPINDILRAKRFMAMQPDMAGCSRPVFDALSKNRNVVSSVAAVSPTMFTDQRIVRPAQLAALLEIGAIHVGEAKYDTTPNASTAAYDYVWGKGFGLWKQRPGASVNELAFGKTFRHYPLTFSSVFDPRVGMGGATHLKVAHSDIEQITASDAGALIDQAVSTTIT